MERHGNGREEDGAYMKVWNVLMWMSKASLVWDIYIEEVGVSIKMH